MDDLYGMLRETLAFLGYSLIIIIPLALWMLKNDKPKYKIMLYCLFIVYIFGVIAQICLPINYHGIALWDNIKNYPYRKSIYLIPFKQPYFAMDDYNAVLRLLKSYILNILLTIPFGIFLRLFKKLRIQTMLAIALLVGFSTETIQLLTGLIVGYHFRITHIDDVLMNAIGVVLGYGLINFAIGKYKRFVAHTELRSALIDE
ncbi:VanZ family protein [Herpetosiphon geysericola]|uniref:VanZ family protein n=1 Tax=Herpetosiphon geysericola TaxID=70996 RepID=UPI0006C904DB|nr:VanZ family protein [Herpetosiphon geysericola]